MSARIPAIDGLRGIAILLVIYQHLFAGAVMDAVRSRFGTYPWVIGNGWMGVGLFFILSGFVLALPFFASDRPLEFWGFVRHRAKRLLPLFLIMCVVSFAFTLHKGAPDIFSFLVTASTLNLLIPSEFFPTINGPFWSLGIEIWFTPFLPVLIWSMRKHGPLRALAAIALAAFVVRCVGAYVPFINVHINPVKDSVFARMDDFAVGAVLAWAFARGKLPALGLRHVAIGLVTMAFAGFLWDLRVQQLMPRGLTAGFNVIQQIGIAILIVSALNIRGRFAEILSVWPLRILGAMCFSIYCWHALLLSPQIQGTPFDLRMQLSFWLALLFLSAVTYRYIEFPTIPIRKLFLLETNRPNFARLGGAVTAAAAAAALWPSTEPARAVPATQESSAPQPSPDQSASVLQDGTYKSKVENFHGRPQVDNAIVMLGDSITDLGAWNEYFPGTAILNRGISGDTTVGVNARLDEVTARKPRAIFLMIGTNDIFFGAEPSVAARRLGAILSRLKSDLPQTKVFVQSAIPTRRGPPFQALPGDGLLSNDRIRSYNEQAQHEAKISGAEWLDIGVLLRGKDGALAENLTYDGIHLNAAGYAVWAKAIRGLVETG